MARIRSIHPGIWTDEAFVSVSRDARLLFIGILNECDDQGAFEWKPLQIKMRLTAGDDASVATVSGWLSELALADLVRTYQVKGSSFGAVRNFSQWQRPKKPNRIHPMPDEFRIYSGPKATGSEPIEHERDDSSELLPHECPTVPNQFPTSGEIHPQMEEIIGGDSTDLRSVCADAPLDTSDYNDLNEAVLSRVLVPIEPRAAVKSAERNGTRLSDEWNPGAEGAKFARDLGIDPARTFERFRDYWRGVAGARGRKVDWLGTWRNWCRKEAEDRGTLPLTPSSPTPSNPGGHAVTPMTGGF